MDLFDRWRDVLLPLLVFGGLLLYRQIVQTRKARRLKDIAPLLNAEAVIRPFSSPKIRGTHMGMPFEIVFVPPGRSAGGMLVLTFSYPCPFSLEVRPRGAAPRLADLLSRGTHIESGNEHFDSQFALKAEKDPEKASHYVMNAHNQELLRKAFEQGIALVRYSERGITLLKPGSYLREDLSGDELADYLTCAARLGERF